MERQVAIYRSRVRELTREKLVELWNRPCLSRQASYNLEAGVTRKYRTRNRDRIAYIYHQNDVCSLFNLPDRPYSLARPLVASRSGQPESWYDRLAANIGGPGCNKPSGVARIIYLSLLAARYWGNTIWHGVSLHTQRVKWEANAFMGES